MKQFIVLIASVMLGLIIVRYIIGKDGILEAMQYTWDQQIQIRNMQIVVQ